MITSRWRRRPRRPPPVPSSRAFGVGYFRVRGWSFVSSSFYNKSRLSLDLGLHLRKLRDPQVCGLAKLKFVGRMLGNGRHASGGCRRRPVGHASPSGPVRKFPFLNMAQAGDSFTPRRSRTRVCPPRALRPGGRAACRAHSHRDDVGPAHDFQGL